MVPRRFLRNVARKLDGPSAAGRLRPMEGLRGFSALIVFLVHFHAMFGHFAAPGNRLHAVSLFGGCFGQAGVDIFFILSGYLIYRIVMAESYPGFLPFVRRRLVRIYPAYLATFALYTAASYAFPAVSKIPAGAGPAALYLAENALLLPPFLDHAAMIVVSWSLSYELAFYLLLPLLAALLRLGRWPARARFLFFLALAGLHLYAGHWNHALFPRAVMFLGGVLLAEAAREPGIAARLGPRGERAAIVFGLAAAAVLGLYNEEGQVELRTFTNLLWLLFPAAGVCVFYTLFHQGALHRFFSRRWLRWAGNASYSYYLIHGFALHGVLRAVSAVAAPASLGPAAYLALFALCLAATLAAALALFLLVEEPFSLGRRAARPAAVVS